jgi:hypothetical protein
MSLYKPISPSCPALPPPSIAVTLAINPPAFKLGEPVELSVTAVSNASQPITIFTWQHIFNVHTAQKRGNFVGWDQDTGMKLPLHDYFITPLRWSYTLGGRFDSSFVTLEPGQPHTFSSSFLLTYGPPFGPPVNGIQSRVNVPKGHAYLLPGHRYLMDICDDYGHMYWWKYGRKEDVLDLPGEDREGSVSSGEDIVLSLDEPVEFKVLPLE